MWRRHIDQIPLVIYRTAVERADHSGTIPGRRGGLCKPLSLAPPDDRINAETIIRCVPKSTIDPLRDQNLLLTPTLLVRPSPLATNGS